VQPPADDDHQYSLRTILVIWLCAVVPMVTLGWGATAAVGDRLDLGVGDQNREAFTRALFLALGLIWQFVLVLIIVLREEGEISWQAISRRCRLNVPRDPQSGLPKPKLWWWLVPLLIAEGLLQVVPLTDVWDAVFPFLGEPNKYSLNELLSSDERRQALEGAWQVFVLFIVLGLFNTVLGEELLFRGILLPRMKGVFGRRDWVANGVIFGLYHLHQPWSILNAIIDGTLLYAYPSSRFRSTWMGIAVHSGQTVFFIFLALGLVLGLA
jgi:membrane protease YdiL (CAAX protease family)